MTSFTEIERKTVRSGWLENNHINVPATVWRPLVPSSFQNRLLILASFENCGYGAVHNQTGHLTGVSDVFDKLGITGADVNLREFRVWGDKNKRAVMIEPVPSSSSVSNMDPTLAPPPSSPGDEVFFVNANDRLHAYRGLPTFGHGSQNVLWLDQSDEDSLPTGPSSPCTLTASEADKLRLKFLSVAQGDNVSPDDETLPDVEDAEEGGGHLRTHLVRERNRGLRNAKLREAGATNPALPCEVCGFEFRTSYGDRGDGFAEVHHLQPFTGPPSSRVTTLNDLAVVCANCHRMLHQPPFCTLTDLRSEVRD